MMGFQNGCVCFPYGNLFEFGQEFNGLLFVEFRIHSMTCYFPNVEYLSSYKLSMSLGMFTLLPRKGMNAFLTCIQDNHNYSKHCCNLLRKMKIAWNLEHEIAIISILNGFIRFLGSNKLLSRQYESFYLQTRTLENCIFQKIR